MPEAGIAAAHRQQRTVLYSEVAPSAGGIGEVCADSGRAGPRKPIFSSSSTSRAMFAARPM